MKRRLRSVGMDSNRDDLAQDQKMLSGPAIEAEFQADDSAELR